MPDLIKYVLTRIGERISQRTVYNLNAAVNYLEVGRWMHAKGYDTTHRYARREQLFDLVGAQVGDRGVLYMEFGVFEGQATRYWSKILHGPDANYTALTALKSPEAWLPQRPKGHFAMRGTLPQIDDVRVEFFKGWFEEILPTYTCPPHDVLVLNLDAGLYSSTSFVLNTLASVIVPGTYIYFDNFNHRVHELRAFDEFMNRTGMGFSLLGVTRTLQHVLFQRTSEPSLSGFGT